jgi:hypothetical protein
MEKETEGKETDRNDEKKKRGKTNKEKSITSHCTLTFMIPSSLRRD